MKPVFNHSTDTLDCVEIDVKNNAREVMESCVEIEINDSTKSSSG